MGTARGRRSVYVQSCFCRRCVKLIDMFATLHQFQALTRGRVEGVEEVTSAFAAIVDAFRSKGHNIVDAGDSA